MTLGKLVQMQNVGALDIVRDNYTGAVSIAGKALTERDCKFIADAIGWMAADKEDWELIDKTNRFIRGIKRHIENEDVLKHTIIEFRNSRKQDTEKFVDRIKMVHSNGKYDLTVIYGLPGSGGRYSVYSAVNGFTRPVYACGSAKLLGIYINNLT